MNLCLFIGLVIYSSHKVLKRILRTFIVLVGLQNQCYRVTDCLLMHDALPSYRNGVLPLNRMMILSINLAIEMKVELDLSERQLFGVLKFMIWSMFTLVTWKLSSWLLGLAPADNPAHIVRHERTVADNSGRILSTTICGSLLPERKLRTSIFFNCLNPSLINSNRPILLICPPPPLKLK